jgi:cytochrome c-type biogenesis protein CcmH/NrfG
MRHLRCLLFLAIATALSAADPSQDNAAAIALYREKKNPEARAAFETLSAANPANAEAHHFLGLIALREKRDDDAIRHHETATALAPTNATYLIALGDAYGRKAASASLFSKLGWAKKCQTTLARAVELEPSSFAANAALIEFYRRAPGMAGGGMDKAYAQAQSFRKLDLAGGTQLLTALYARESQFPELFAALDEALKTHPDHYLLLLTFGRTSADSGQQLDRGLASLQRCLDLTPPPRAPSHANAWFYLGQIRARQNDLPAASTAYENALKLEPTHREAAAALEKLPRATLP